MTMTEAPDLLGTDLRELQGLAKTFCGRAMIVQTPLQFTRYRVQ